MSEACSGAPDGGPVRRNAGAFRAGEWLSLAAAPTFAIMGLLTRVLDGDAPAILCAHDASPLSSMTAMYGLMSAFHVTPWLKLISSAKSGAVVISSETMLRKRLTNP